MWDETGMKTVMTMANSEVNLYLYYKQVILAIYNNHNNHVVCPGKAQHEFIQAEMAKYGFLGYIGIEDGCYIKLARNPCENMYA